MTSKGISIIICCFNSANKLPATLKHIALLQVPEDTPVELIIINNNSTDKTTDTLHSEWSKYQTSIHLRTCQEKNPGLIFARKRGIDEACFEYIIFCDDDNWLRDDYLCNAFNIMESNPEIGALGGDGEAVSSIKIPSWFYEVQSDYACGKQFSRNGDITSERKYLWGAGLVSRLYILRNVFNPRFPLLLLGRKENELLAGDDSEICKRIVLMGYKLYYDNSLHFKHDISPNRLSGEYYKKISLGFQASAVILDKYDYVIRQQQKGHLLLLVKLLNLALDSLLQYMKGKIKTKKSYERLLVGMDIYRKKIHFTKDDDYRAILNFALNNKYI